MKKSLLALAVLALSGSAFACSGSSCTSPGYAGATATVSGSNSVLSGSVTSASASGAGQSSTSFASNVTTASTAVGASATAAYDAAKCDTSMVGAVGINGKVDLTSKSVAWNVSTGGAQGFAAAGGLAKAETSGVAGFYGSNGSGSIVGGVAGHADATLASGVLAKANQGGTESAVAGSSFLANASSSISTDGTCTNGKCVVNSDLKNAETTSVSSAYSDKATGTVTGVAGVAASGSLVNADADAIAAAGGKAKVGQTVTSFQAAR